ncbi:MAG: metal ABC transporter permease, partial [Pseudomonadota bacterium]
MPLDTLFAPFSFDFMLGAFALSLMAAVPTALLSCFLVVRGWALLGDAVSHSVLPGVVLAYILNIPLLVGAFAAGMLCSLASGYLSDNSRVKPDTVMGVVFSGMFGLGLVMYTAIETNVHLDHILFGNLLGVETHELWTSGIVG